MNSIWKNNLIEVIQKANIMFYIKYTKPYSDPIPIPLVLMWDQNNFITGNNFIVWYQKAQVCKTFDYLEQIMSVFMS